LTVTVAGVALTTKPTMTVHPGAVSSGSSTASFAMPAVVSGGTDTVTIVVKDAAGNAISGLASSAFHLGLSGTSAGSFGAVTESATPGTYTATFTANTAGTASTLTVTVSGIVLNPRPTLTVTGVTPPNQPPVPTTPLAPGEASGTNSTASFATPTVVLVVKKRGRGRKQHPRILAATDILTIAVKDSAGNPMAGLTNNVFGLSLVGGSSTGIFGPVTQTPTPGTYQALFTATKAGTASQLAATVNGVALATTPTVTVLVNRKRRPLHHRPNHG
jgi:adhesin/invasin